MRCSEITKELDNRLNIEVNRAVTHWQAQVEHLSRESKDAIQRPAATLPRPAHSLRKRNENLVNPLVSKDSNTVVAQST